MKTTLKDGICLIALEGRIDSTNAPETEREMEAVLNANPGTEIAFDAAELAYLSSAGLRILMRVRKKLGRSLTVKNVSPEVYEIFETTGFTELLDVQKRLRKVSVEGCAVIGQGGNGTVYRIDADTIIKVYNPGASLEKIALEKKYARAAFASGIPTAISFDTVEVGECYGIVFELLNAKTVGAAISEQPEKLPEYSEKMGKLFRLLHNTHMAPGVLPTMKDKASGWIDYMEANYLQPEDAALLRRVLCAVPERDTVIHSDFHEGNVMVQNGELMLIDLDDVCTGHPIFDLALNYMSHVVAAQSMPAVIEKSLQMSPENALKARQEMLKSYFGTDDAAVLTQYEQLMGMFTAFLMILVPAKSKDSSNLPPQMVQMLLDASLPPFRQVAPMIPAVLSKLF